VSRVPCPSSILSHLWSWSYCWPSWHLPAFYAPVAAGLLLPISSWLLFGPTVSVLLNLPFMAPQLWGLAFWILCLLLFYTCSQERVRGRQNVRDFWGLKMPSVFFPLSWLGSEGFSHCSAVSGNLLRRAQSQVLSLVFVFSFGSLEASGCLLLLVFLNFTVM
jgi:hypothetical protein